jgi:hypothetical protein
MKDILVAYGRQTIMAYRNALAEVLREAVERNKETLIHQRWSRRFVEEFMAHQAKSAILGGDECSGDPCRIVSAAALLVRDGDKEHPSPDQTIFWRNNLQSPVEDREINSSDLTSDTVIALVKLLFVQWSHEFDYGLYFELPWEITVS